MRESIAEKKETIERQIEERRTYRRYMRLMAGGMFSLLGTLAAIYIGGWLMLLKPIQGTVGAFMAGGLTIPEALGALVKVVCAMPVSGAIWCCGYILKRKCIGHPEY